MSFFLITFLVGILVGKPSNDSSVEKSQRINQNAGQTDTMAGIQMAWCPVGAFVMEAESTKASNNSKSSEERRSAQIKTGFWLSTCEITKWQWLQVMGTQPWKSRPSVFDRPDTPVVYANYYDAQAFCTRLSQATGAAWRLPREEEWEYAARAGTTGPFYFSQNFPEDFEATPENCESHMWYAETLMESAPWAQTIGQLSANPWGFHDIHGNVQEWCTVLERNKGDRETDQAAARGGCWDDMPPSSVVWHSRKLKKQQSDPYTGFRIVLEEHAAERGMEFAFAFAPTPSEEEWLAMGRGSNGFNHWLLPQLQAHPEALSGMDVSPDGAFLATVSWDETVKLWNISDQQKTAQLDVDMIWHMVRVSPGGKFVALNDAFAMLEGIIGGPPEITLIDIWDVQNNTRVARFDADCQDLRFSHDGRYLAILAHRSLHLYSTKSWEVVRTLTVGDPQGLEMDPVKIGFNKDASSITVLEPYHRYTYRVTDGNCIGESQVDPEPFHVVNAALSTAEPALTMVNAEPSVCSFRFWMDHAEELKAFTPPLPVGGGPGCYSPDGKYFLQEREDTWIDLMTMPFYTIVKRFPIRAEALMVTPDGTRFIAYSGKHVYTACISGEPQMRYFFDNPILYEEMAPKS